MYITQNFLVHHLALFSLCQLLLPVTSSWVCRLFFFSNLFVISLVFRFSMEKMPIQIHCIPVDVCLLSCNIRGVHRERRETEEIRLASCRINFYEVFQGEKHSFASPSHLWFLFHLLLVSFSSSSFLQLASSCLMRNGIFVCDPLL